MSIEVAFSAVGIENLADKVAGSVEGLFDWQRQKIRELIHDHWAAARRLETLAVGDVCEFKGRRFIVVKGEFAGDIVVEFEDGGKRNYAVGTLKPENTVYLGRGKIVRRIEIVTTNEQGA